MQGRNRKIFIPIILGILVIFAFVIFNNQVKPKQTDENVRITEAPTEQRLEQSNSSHEKQEDEQVSFDPEAAEIKSVDTSTPVAHKDSTAKQETEAPTSAPLMNTPNPWKETAYPPTCEEDGYIIRENTVEGYSVTVKGQNALGHDYGEWIRNPETEMMETTCTRCGRKIQRQEIYDGIIPRIDLSGNMEGISKENRVTLTFDYASPAENFSCYSFTTWQGHNTLNFPKKNYTIRLYNDSNITDKHKLSFNGWQREHKYVLKANYRDVSQTRNLTAAKLWAEMAATRPNLFETLRHTSNYGAVDGFPVIVYLNGEFHGLYTMNLHIDDDLYQMDHAYDAVMITNSTETMECRFLAEATFTDPKNAWEVEFCGTGKDTRWAEDKLNELIRFVINNDDGSFREHLGDYLDVDGAIDYLIFLYVTGLRENAVKDLVLLKYHDCDVWIPSVYDLEGAFGLDLDAVTYIGAETFLPSEQDGVWSSGTGSQLWDRILQAFGPEIRTRYAELRKTVLTEKGLADYVNAYMAQIPEEYIEKDLMLWPRQLPEEKPQEQIIRYITLRLPLLDNIWLNE